MRPVVLKGRVIRGEGLAATTGYPTANLDRRFFQRHPVASGVYVGWAEVGRRRYGCLIIVGVPFIRQPKRGAKVEAYLLNFRGNLRGRRLTATVIQKLRFVRSYADRRSLVAQIGRDIRQAMRILRSHGYRS